MYVCSMKCIHLHKNSYATTVICIIRNLTNLNYEESYFVWKYVHMFIQYITFTRNTCINKVTRFEFWTYDSSRVIQTMAILTLMNFINYEFKLLRRLSQGNHWEILQYKFSFTSGKIHTCNIKYRNDYHMHFNYNLINK